MANCECYGAIHSYENAIKLAKGRKIKQYICLNGGKHWHIWQE